MKRINKMGLMLVIVAITNLSVWAQKPEKPDFEKIKAEKVAFFSSTLALTPAEAEKFWPVYNELEKKKGEIWGKRREFEEKLENEFDKMSENECKELSRKMSSMLLEDGKLSTEYNEKFLNILPAKKVVQIYQAEMKFRHQLLRSYRDKEKKGNE
jgi:hypothetical protein